MKCLKNLTLKYQIPFGKVFTPTIKAVLKEAKHNSINKFEITVTEYITVCTRNFSLIHLTKVLFQQKHYYQNKLDSFAHRCCRIFAPLCCQKKWRAYQVCQVCPQTTSQSKKSDQT